MPFRSQEQGNFHIYTAQQRPDLLWTLDQADHPLNLLWPAFLDHDLTFKLFVPLLSRLDALTCFQFMAVERDPGTGKERVIGLARSIPFYWPELSKLNPTDSILDYAKILKTLPDGGYDTILARGVHQCLARGGLFEQLALTVPEGSNTASTSTQLPNALSALSISVQRDRRQTGLAEIFIRKMKQVAAEENLKLLVVPLRPTQKSTFPLVDMPEYIKWTLDHNRTIPGLEDRQNHFDCLQKQQRQERDLPFDPWLRKHVRLGGEIVKVAPNSMLVRGTTEQWSRWTGVNFEHQASRQTDHTDILIPGGLVPVRYYPSKGVGVYVEPNVWVCHDLRG